MHYTQFHKFNWLCEPFCLRRITKIVKEREQQKCTFVVITYQCIQRQLNEKWKRKFTYVKRNNDRILRSFFWTHKLSNKYQFSIWKIINFQLFPAVHICDIFLFFSHSLLDDFLMLSSYSIHKNVWVELRYVFYLNTIINSAIWTEICVCVAQVCLCGCKHF